MAKIPSRVSNEVALKYLQVNEAFLQEKKSNPKDRIEVVIGDDKQPDTFYPQAKIMRWDNEVNASFRYVDKEPGEAEIRTEGEVIKYIKPKVEFQAYDLDPADGLEDGGLEIELLLKEKPDTNKFDFTIQTKELDFLYQPALTQEEIDQGLERPDDVVGSYAVYHKTKGGMNESRGKEYKVGKAFQIYRPFAHDANGDGVYADLNVDAELGVLTVTVDQKFLDSAVYPVVVDPTFGYTSVGATTSNINNNYVIGVSVNSTVSSNGTVDSVSAYIKYQAAGPCNMKGIVTDDAYGILSNGVGTPVALSGTSSWKTSSFGTPPSVTNANDYFPCVINDYYITINMDDGNYGDGFFKSGNNYTTPTNPTTPTLRFDVYSIYATYTASATNITVTPGVQTITSSQPTPTITTETNITVSAGVQTLTFSQPSPTVTVEQNVTVSASVQTATASQPVPTVSTTQNVTASANALTLTASQPVVTVATVQNVTISAGVQTLTATLPVPTIVGQGPNSHSLDLEIDSNQYVYITDANQTGLDITGDMTLEKWFEFETLPVTDERMNFVGKYDSFAGIRSYLFGVKDVAGSKSLYISISSDGINVTEKSVSFTPTVGVYYHFAVVYDASAGTADFYVNGTREGAQQTGLPTSIHGNASDFFLGGFRASSNAINGFLDGRMDEVRIWNITRTQTELDENKDHHIAGSETGLVGYWRFNNDLLDETANNNDLTASGSPVFSTDVPFTGVASITVSANVQSMTSSQPAVTVSAVQNVTVSEVVQSLAFSQPAPVVSAEVNATVFASVQTLTASQPLPTISTTRNVDVAVDVASLTFSQPEIAVSAGGDVAVVVGTQLLISSQPTPSVNLGTTVSLGVVTINASQPQPSVAIGIDVALSVLELVASLPSPTIISFKDEIVQVLPMVLSLIQNPINVMASSYIDKYTSQGTGWGNKYITQNSPWQDKY